MWLVRELDRQGSEGTFSRRALLWFLFWPLLLAMKFAAKARSSNNQAERRLQSRGLVRPG